MAELCTNCVEKITKGGIIAAANQYLGARALSVLNFVQGTRLEATCGKCGGSSLRFD